MSIEKKKVLRILVVEDTPADVFLIKFYLEELDPGHYDIESVDRLEDAHKKLQANYYDAVLLDFNLPDSQGMVTLTSSVEKFPDQIFIVLTGYSEESVGIEAVHKGAEDFLVKGQINGDVLDSSIKFAVNRLRLRTRINRHAETLRVLEKTSNLATFFASVKEGVFEHGPLLIDLLQLDNRIESYEEFASLFDAEKELMSTAEDVEHGKHQIVHGKLKDTNFSIKLHKGNDFDVVVGVVTRLA